MNGKLFFIEAVDLAGKTTQIDLLKEELGDNFRFYREPGGTPNSEAIRKVIFETANTSSQITQALLFAAAREELYSTIVKDLSNGINVICDRSYISTFVYQGYVIARETNKIQIDKISDWNPNFILLDIDEDEFLRRINTRDEEIDSLEREVIEDFNNYRKRYIEAIMRQVGEDNRFFINGSEPKHTVLGKILKIINLKIKGE